MSKPWRGVVVGVDGSAAALRAVAWAAHEAQAQNEPLTIVHAHVWPLLRVPGFATGWGPAGGLRIHAEGLVSEAATRARESADVDVRTEVVVGFAVPVLVSASDEASCVVVGSRGLGAASGLLAGSTTIDLIGQAHAPVVVIPPEQRTSEHGTDLVVAGFDGSDTATRALQAAFDVAAYRGSPLLVVQAVPSERSPGQHQGIAQTQRMLAAALMRWAPLFPEVEASSRLIAGEPNDVLRDLSEQAALVVVGSRGCGGFKGMVLGSVSQSLAHHAHCALMVVTPTARIKRADSHIEQVTGGMS